MKDLKRIVHPLVHVDDTDDTKYDKYGRVDYVKKNGVWVFGNWVNKDIKKTTPDGNPNDINNLPMFCNGDVVHVDNKKSLRMDTNLDGTYYFDSYDSWDNTCYISKTPLGSCCYWVLLSDITLIDRGDKLKKIIKNKTKK